MTTTPTLTWIGTGSAFNSRDGNTASILRYKDVVALFDCGFTVPNELRRLGIIDEITHVFISHTHSDHAGGLELLAQWRYFASLHGKGIKPPTLVVPNDILERLRLNEQLGLGAIQDPHGRPVKATLETYFDLHNTGGYRGYLLSSEEDEDEDELRVFYEPADHVPGGTFPSYSWRIRHAGPEVTQPERFSIDRETIFETLITGDIRVPSEYLGQANLAFHDCQLAEGPHCGAGDVHANIYKLMLLPPEIKAKTWLVHYGDTWEAFQDIARDAGFSGFARPGQAFNLV